MNESDELILKEIVSHVDAIDERIAKHKIDEDSFVSNSDLQDMLLMPVFQIGELAHSLSNELREDNPDIPWNEIISFRNIIAHDYGIVDSMWAWNTIEIDIPELKSKINQLL